MSDRCLNCGLLGTLGMYCRACEWFFKNKEVLDAQGSDILEGTVWHDPHRVVAGDDAGRVLPVSISGHADMVFIDEAASIEFADAIGVIDPARKPTAIGVDLASGKDQSAASVIDGIGRTVWSGNWADLPPLIGAWDDFVKLANAPNGKVVAIEDVPQPIIVSREPCDG